MMFWSMIVLFMSIVPLDYDGAQNLLLPSVSQQNLLFMSLGDAGVLTAV